ncbi:Uncharacterized protein NV38_0001438 [Leptospira kirschneri serovar Mozdok]|nr:Uncharacterized protein NV38_0001438 [Leptospira kirschneri serovar Mozdok]NDK06168.1 hypothetical protein [Leptospira kirschneri serovar Mozdok]
MNELKHNAFLKLNASLPKGRSAGRVRNSAQRFPMGRVVGSSYWYFIKIESDSGISQ